MPQHALRPSPEPQALPYRSSALDLGSHRFAARANAPPEPLAELLQASGTTAFVVVRRGQVAWEFYPNGGAPDRPQRCFSVTKSVASALLGLAARAGCIDSLQTPIGHWLPELRDPGVAALTLEHLLQMRSGIRFREGLWPWCDEPRTYYATDLRQRLVRCRIGEPVGAFFHYNDWHPQLLSLVLERATGQPVSCLLRRHAPMIVRKANKPRRMNECMYPPRRNPPPSSTITRRV